MDKQQIKKTSKIQWTRWYRFHEIFEYHGPIDFEYKKTNQKIYKYKDLSGPLHTDDGFRLRSMERFSNKNFPLETPLSKLKCPLSNGDIGCYWIKIKKINSFDYNYIGRTWETKNGIRKRLTSHLRELNDLPNDPNGNFKLRDIRGIGEFRKKFKEASAIIRKKIGNISDPSLNFFKDYVTIKFIKILPGTKKTETIERDIAKIEGMALAAYKHNYKDFPNLNSVDETSGLNGFFD